MSLEFSLTRTRDDGQSGEFRVWSAPVNYERIIIASELLIIVGLGLTIGGVTHERDLANAKLKATVEADLRNQKTAEYLTSDWAKRHDQTGTLPNPLKVPLK